MAYIVSEKWKNKTMKKQVNCVVIFWNTNKPQSPLRTSPQNHNKVSRSTKKMFNGIQYTVREAAEI